MLIKTNLIGIKKIVIIISILLSTSQNILSQDITSNAKITFLEKFTRFINWPNNSELSDSSSSFRIATIGTETIDNEIYDFYKSRKIKGRDVKIISIRNIEEINNCDLLFIRSSERERLGEIIEFTKGKPILTISDSEGFSECGVIINMFSENDKLKFQINETALKSSRLDLKFKLLSLAEIVNPVCERE